MVKDLANSFMVVFGLIRYFQLGFRLGICKREVGSQGGLPRIKAVTRIDILVAIGRLESRGSGIHVLIFLAKSLLINSLTKCKLPIFFLDSFSIFSQDMGHTSFGPRILGYPMTTTM